MSIDIYLVIEFDYKGSWQLLMEERSSGGVLEMDFARDSPFSYEGVAYIYFMRVNHPLKWEGVTPSFFIGDKCWTIQRSRIIEFVGIADIDIVYITTVFILIFKYLMYRNKFSKDLYIHFIKVDEIYFQSFNLFLC